MTLGDASSGVAERRRDRIVGLLIVFVAFVLSLGISLWAKKKSAPEQDGPLPPPTTEGIVGWPNAVDAEKNLPRARQVTRRLLLRGFVAEGVHSDGTIDMTGPGSSVRYSFQSPPGEGPLPPRERGLARRRELCGRQNVWIRENGLAPDPDLAETACSPRTGEPLPEPECTLAQVWKWAIEKQSVPPEAIARVEYYRATSGPAFRFEKQDHSSSFAIDGACTRELTRREASGHVP